MYRIKNEKPEIFLVHPGGPFYKNKDEGCWSIPKGETEDHETDMLDTAKREFEEETGFKPVGTFVPLGSAESKSGKTAHAWAFEGDCDPAKLTSNMISIDWPPKSGQKLEIPEVDRGDFFTPEIAKKKVVSYMVPLIESFERFISS